MVDATKNTGTQWVKSSCIAGITGGILLLLPLLPALMFVGYSLMVPIILPSTEIQKAVRALIIGIPLAILIYYGRRTGDGIGSTLSGALLFPFFMIYSQVLSHMFDPGFVMTPLGGLIRSAFTSTVPFGLILGVMGYCASRRTNGSLLIAVSLASLVIVIILGIN